MALPQGLSFSTVKTQETDYGSEQGMLRRAPATTSQHPLESSERTYLKHQEQLQMSIARKTFGMGFGLHLKHERAAAGCPQIGHMSFLPRSNAHLDALTGNDLLLDFNDTLGMEQELTANPHLQMEKLQALPSFKL